MKLTKLSKILIMAIGLIILVLLGFWPSNAIKDAGIKKRLEYSQARVFEKVESTYLKNAGKNFKAFSYCIVEGETITMNGFTEAQNVSQICYTKEYEEWIRFDNYKTVRYKSGTDEDGNAIYSSKRVRYDDYKWQWFTENTQEVKASWYTLNGLKTKVGTETLKKTTGNYTYEGTQPFALYVGTRGRTRWHYSWTANKSVFYGFIEVQDGAVVNLKVGNNAVSAQDMKGQFCKPGIGHIIFIIVWCLFFTGGWTWLVFWLNQNTELFNEQGRRDKNHWFYYRLY